MYLNGSRVFNKNQNAGGVTIMSDKIIKKNLDMSSGSDETTTLELCADPKDGRVWLVLKKEVRQYFELTELKEAQDLFDRITGGGGRPVVKMSDFAPK
jgi:hypothetical protein